MKIALCFSGMLRTFDVCLPTITKNVIEANSVDNSFDSFLVTWMERGKNVHWWNNTTDVERVDPNNFLNYRDVLNLKSFRMDAYIGSDFMKRVEEVIQPGQPYGEQEGSKCNPMNVMPMLRNIDRCHKLMLENLLGMTNTKYDLVMKLRTDLKFNSPMVIHTPQPNTLYMPNHELWGPAPGWNDQLVYGDLSTMNVFASMWRNLRTLYLDCGKTLHPETLFARFITDNNINVVRYPIDYRIER